MAFRKTTFRNILSLGSYTYTGEVLSFLASIILARLLLPEEYGFVAMIMILTNFAMILTGVGIGSDIVRSNYGYTYHKAITNLSLYIGISLCLVVIAMAYPLSLFYENSKLILPTILISTQFIFKSIVVVQYSLLMKWQRFSLLGRIELSANLISIILMIAMAYLGFSYWALIIPLIIADIYKYLMYNIFTDIRIKLYPLKYTIVAFKHAKSIIGSILGIRIISYWGRNLDNLLIGKQFGEGPLGIYNRGYRFLTLSEKLFESVFGSVLYPSLQKLKEEDGDVIGEYLFFMGIICFLTYPIGTILILFPELLVSILWGPNWMEVAELLPYFGLIIFKQANTTNTETMLKLYYKDFLLFKIGVFNAIITITAIILGSFFSPLMIAKFLAISNILIILPTVVFYGFGKYLKFGFNRIIWLYLPRIIIFIGVFVSVSKNQRSLSIIFIVLYFCHLFLIQRKSLGKLYHLIVQRLRKK